MVGPAVSAALVAVTRQVPLAEMTWSLPATIEHAVEDPASKLRAPVPEPPEVVIVASAAPEAMVEGPVTVRVAWSALVIVTSKGAEVAEL